MILQNPKLVALESLCRADCRSPPSSSFPSLHPSAAPLYAASSNATQSLAAPDSPALKLLNSFCYDAGKAIAMRWRNDYEASSNNAGSNGAVLVTTGAEDKRAFFRSCFDQLWELVPLFHQMETEGVVLARGKSKRKSIKAFVRDKVQMVFCTTTNSMTSSTGHPNDSGNHQPALTAFSHPF